MAAWLVILVVTNALTLAVLSVFWRRSRDRPADVDEVFVAPRPAGVTGSTRRLITIEVLNPIELVSSRGRVAGLAGSLAPGIARRFVYDQILKTLRRELADKQVLADVHLHQLRPGDRAITPHMVDVHREVAAPEAIDEVSEIDLDQF